MSVCPSCGYCPCCGHRHNTYPYWPYQQPYTVWNTAGTNATIGQAATTLGGLGGYGQSSGLSSVTQGVCCDGQQTQ